MYNRFKKLDAKMRAAIVSITLSLVWLIFGSSVSILSPTAGKIGVLFGGLSAVFICLGPLWYVKLKNIKVKNPRPTFIEPPASLAILVYFVIVGKLCLCCLIIVSLPPVAALIELMGDDSFMSNSLMMFILLTGLSGPACVYVIYILMHYKRIIQYNTPEWKRLRAERKAAKKG